MQSPQLKEMGIEIRVKSADELRKFIGKTIKMRVTRYAHQRFDFDDNYRNCAGNIAAPVITGKLISITESPVTTNQRYALVFSGEANVYNKNDKCDVTYFMSNSEIEGLNHNTFLYERSFLM